MVWCRRIFPVALMVGLAACTGHQDGAGKPSTQVAPIAPTNEFQSPRNTTKPPEIAAGGSGTGAVVPASWSGEGLASPITIASLNDWAARNRLSSVAQVLSALPSELRANFVLVKESHSGHLSDTSHPRLITFAPDAHFMLAASSVPHDPEREIIELAELQSDGSWLFRSLDFSSGQPVAGTSDFNCQLCHGRQPRPIWGSYPNWPDALGDYRGALTAEQFAMVKGLPTDSETADRFAWFTLDLAAGQNTALLPAPTAGAPNAVFSRELGQAAALALYRRAAAAPAWSKVRNHLLLKAQCAQLANSGDAVGDAVALLGSFPDYWSQLGLSTFDFALDKRVGSSMVTSDGEWWSDSSTNLMALVLFKAFLEVYDATPAVQSVFGARPSAPADLTAVGTAARRGTLCQALLTLSK